MKIELDGETYNVQFDDTAGQEEYDALRKFSYDYVSKIILILTTNTTNIHN